MNEMYDAAFQMAQYVGGMYTCSRIPLTTAYYRTLPALLALGVRHAPSQAGD